VVYGTAIAAGLVISGDRIVGVLGAVLQRPRMRALLGSDEEKLADSDERREVLEKGAASV
jgi:hypothetical protein